MNFKTILALGAGLLGTSAAFADTVKIDFESFDATYGISIGNAYAGQGVTFGPDALSASNNDGVGGYYTGAPSSNAVMFVSPGYDSGTQAYTQPSATMNVASGFSSASFYYSSPIGTSVNVYSGTNGQGTLLEHILLGANDGSCTNEPACVWDKITTTFNGVAQSITFGDAFSLAANNGAAFDNIEVAPVPLPAAAWLLLSGMGSLGAFARRKRAAA